MKPIDYYNHLCNLSKQELFNMAWQQYKKEYLEEAVRKDKLLSEPECCNYYEVMAENEFNF